MQYDPLHHVSDRIAKPAELLLAARSQSLSDAPSSKDLELPPGSANGTLSARAQPAFDGTIASACESGIGLEGFIEMARVARWSDPRVASFLDAWDALETSRQQASSADALCRQTGFTPTELLKVVAAAACQYSMYVAQLSAAVALPSVVQRSIDVALTDDGTADRKMQFQHAGFLPTPKGSQTTIAIMQQNSQASAPAGSNSVVAAPKPEETIRRMVDRFNEHRELPARRVTADLEPAHVRAFEEENDDV